MFRNSFGTFKDNKEFTDFLDKHHPFKKPEDPYISAPAEPVHFDPLSKQIGGDHYRSLAIQPVAYIHANKILFIEGSIIKYVTRWRNKGGLKDLEKAKHFIDLLIQLESADPVSSTDNSLD